MFILHVLFSSIKKSTSAILNPWGGWGLVLCSGTLRLDNTHERRVEAEERRRGKPLWNHHHTRFLLVHIIVAIVTIIVVIWWEWLQTRRRAGLSCSENGGASLGATKVQVSPTIGINRGPNQWDLWFCPKILGILHLPCDGGLLSIQLPFSGVPLPAAQRMIQRCKPFSGGCRWNSPWRTLVFWTLGVLDIRAYRHPRFLDLRGWTDFGWIDTVEIVTHVWRSASITDANQEIQICFFQVHETNRKRLDAGYFKVCQTFSGSSQPKCDPLKYSPGQPHYFPPTAAGKPSWTGKAIHFQTFPNKCNNYQITKLLKVLFWSKTNTSIQTWDEYIWIFCHSINLAWMSDKYKDVESKYGSREVWSNLNWGHASPLQQCKISKQCCTICNTQ